MPKWFSRLDNHYGGCNNSKPAYIERERAPVRDAIEAEERRRRALCKAEDARRRAEEEAYLRQAADLQVSRQAEMQKRQAEMETKQAEMEAMRLKHEARNAAIKACEEEAQRKEAEARACMQAQAAAEAAMLCEEKEKKDAMLVHAADAAMQVL